MTQLLELQEKLRDTGAAIAQHERAMANSKSPSLASALRSLQKRLDRLESEYTELTRQFGIDVCSYRLFGDRESAVPAVAIFAALEAFQMAFSVAYDAVKRGPRAKASLTADVRHESEFQFGYAFSGSVGIVMTFKNEQLMLETALDQSMDALFDLARSKTADEVLAKSKTLGASVVKAAHKWASNHVNAGLGVDVKWIRGATEKSRLLLQIPELKTLVATLANATEDIEDTVTLAGVLVGVETESSRRFHFKSDDGEDIKGYHSHNVISIENPASSPARYEATFERKMKKIMATDEEVSATYFLVKLNPLSTPA